MEYYQPSVSAASEVWFLEALRPRGYISVSVYHFPTDQPQQKILYSPLFGKFVSLLVFLQYIRLINSNFSFSIQQRIILFRPIVWTNYFNLHFAFTIRFTEVVIIAVSITGSKRN